MITGLHAVIFSRDAEADRTFLRDVLGFAAIDAGGGWLIFAAPPAELAVHPAETGGAQELYLMCDDLDAEVARLAGQGAACGPITEPAWGRVTAIRLPGGGELKLYQRRHPTAAHMT